MPVGVSLSAEALILMMIGSLGSFHSIVLFFLCRVVARRASYVVSATLPVRRAMMIKSLTGSTMLYSSGKDSSRMCE